MQIREEKGSQDCRIQVAWEVESCAAGLFPRLLRRLKQVGSTLRTFLGYS